MASTTGEKVDRFVTYGLLIKELLAALARNPKIQEAAIEEVIKTTKGGRTRGDELFFFTSLTSLPGVSKENKILFQQKHCELLSPDLNGKNSQEIAELRKKEKAAKGLVFLFAEDKTIADPNPAKRFQYAKEIWHGIFMGIDNFPDDNGKLEFIERQILYFGRNSQEKRTPGEIGEILSKWNDTIIPPPAEDYAGPFVQIGRTFKKIFRR